MKIASQSQDEMVLQEGSTQGLIVGGVFVVAGPLAWFFLRESNPVVVWIALALVVIGVAIILFASSITVTANKTSGRLSYQKKRLVGAQNYTYNLADVFRIETRKQWRMQNAAQPGNQGATAQQPVLVAQSVIVFKDGRELALDHQKRLPPPRRDRRRGFDERTSRGKRDGRANREIPECSLPGSRAAEHGRRHEYSILMASKGNDATVVGSCPNGLTAAIVLARAGLRVTVLEAQPTIGGGARTAALTLPGFLHDICSAAHPMAVSSPAFQSFPLAEHGLEWIHSPAPLSHPFDDGTAITLERSVEKTAPGSGYRTLMRPLVNRWPDLSKDVVAPLHFPAHPLLFSRFGALALWPASLTARVAFREPQTRALFAGIAAHSILPLEFFGSAAFGWVLGAAAHAVGWPIAKGGSQKHQQRARIVFRISRRTHRDQHARRSKSGRSEVVGHPSRPHAAPGPIDRGRPSADRLSAASSKNIATAPACSKWTGHSVDPSPGTRARVRAPPPCI